MTPFFAFGMPGMPEIILIFVVLLLLFGARRIPELARGLGQSINEFRRAREEFEGEITASTCAPSTPRPAAHETPPH